MFVSERLVQRYQRTHQRKHNEAITAKKAEQNLSSLSELVRTINQNRKTRHGK